MTSMERALAPLRTAREEAYVTALLHAETGGTVAGTIGAVDTALLWAAGLRPIPLMSRDASQIEHAPAEWADLCEPLRATAGYAAMDRCPLIHASSAVFVNASCPLRVRLAESWDSKRMVPVPGALSEQAPVIEEAIGRVPWDRLRAVRRIDAKRRSLIASLTDCLRTRRLTLAEWALAVGEHPFLEDPETQTETLAAVLHAAQERALPEDHEVKTLGYSLFYGADPDAIAALDARGTGWHLLSYGCEEEDDGLTAVALSVPQRNCCKEPTAACEERCEIGMAVSK